MAEPASKKARTDEPEAMEETVKEGATEEPQEPEAHIEREEDAQPKKGEKVKDGAICFHSKDTTVNVMQSTVGSMLMPLTDEPLQYLVAAARASCGVKSGRYAFEVKIIELMHPLEDSRQRLSQGCRSSLRIGFSTQSASLFVGETAVSVCFDMEGNFVFNKSKTMAASELRPDTCMTVVLNLDGSSPNANTVSLFSDGKRVSQPQTLPESLVGKALFPSISFKNCTIHYNFGPDLLSPLPFKCHTLKEALTKDVVLVPAPAVPADGKYEVVFPVGVPDEGIFDYLDLFLEQHPHYTEISDRAVMSWAQASGLTRVKSAALSLGKASNDRPDMGFGIPALDDANNIRRILHYIASRQNRNYVVMEVKGSLVKADRADLVARWTSSGFKLIARVAVGSPTAAFKKRSLELGLTQKQEASDVEFKAKQEAESKKRAAEKKQKAMERERRIKLKKQQKQAQEFKKRAEADRRRREIEKNRKIAEARGEDFQEPEEEEMKPEDEEKDEEEEEEEPEVEETPMDQEPPKVELTEEEKKRTFRATPLPDVSQYVLNTSFPNFSIPEKNEGFAEVKFDWDTEAKAKTYLQQWKQVKKATTRVEDIKPGEWFTSVSSQWQKTLQTWHARQSAYKAQVAKKAAEKEAKAQRKAALAIAREKEATAKKEREEKRAAAREIAIASGQPVPEEEPEEVEAPVAAEEEEKPEKEDGSQEVNFEDLNVFGVEDVTNIGNGQPLFSSFSFEDWTMMTLRFEMYLLATAFTKDVDDPDRHGIPLEHLPFYYNRYFKKALNVKFFGVETAEELLDFIKDTVVVSAKKKVLQPCIPDNMDGYSIFAMLTEEARRDRSMRIDLGDESARIKMSQPQMPTALGAMKSPVPASMAAMSRLANAPVKPGLVASARPSGASWTSPPGSRPSAAVAFGGGGAVRPSGMGAPRPWHGAGMTKGGYGRS